MTTGEIEAIDLYWRPGCPYCASLKLGLKRRKVPVRLHNIWEDPAAAAVVRRAARGNETVPTVVVGNRALVNPSARAVEAMVRDVAPDLLHRAPAERSKRQKRRRG